MSGKGFIYSQQSSNLPDVVRLHEDTSVCREQNEPIMASRSHHGIIMLEVVPTLRFSYLQPFIL